MSAEISYSLSPVQRSEQVEDVEISACNRTFRLMGRFGHRLTDSAVKALEEGKDLLPVLVGAGSRQYLEAVLKAHPGPMAVVDKEEQIMKMTGTDQVLAKFRDRVLLIHSGSSTDALTVLTRWQMQNQGRPFLSLSLPSYLRLDRSYYKELDTALKTGAKYDFWARSRYSKFKADNPRILLITTDYFLMGEIIAACQRLDVPHRLLDLQDKEMGREDFVRDFLQAVLEFRPDFVFTINHMGLDREGVLVDLLEKMELPLASWFVDNPHLILYRYQNLASPLCTIFTWDSDNLPSLSARGFNRVHYLPLATDAQRFVPGRLLSGFPGQARDISFVGNSMVHKVRARLDRVLKADQGKRLGAGFQEVAGAFIQSRHNLVSSLLEEKFPALWRDFQDLPDMESRLDYEALVTWESTRIYRKKCVERILPFHPLIAGDDGWKETFIGSDKWAYVPELNYYADLPGFYAHARINFNTTSAQMKGAVNQRVFDVPACGSFLITDHRRQLEDLLEPGREVVCYHELDEIGDLVRYYLKNPDQRNEVAARARKRVLDEHTYDHRLRALCAQMKKIYG
ncbi:CgeB family protein [Desulfonatronovibrio hydrogenovorans]|uniref:CgeB family protein n=1 Tax=Desulfonatronovibrio hydrogenovorans TaxID=53245 RepID=UPI00068E16B3|nr:glycosyltransferase [Desulfonatronovibrio hydrogenovorans]